MNLRGLFGLRRPTASVALDRELLARIQSTFDEASEDEEHFPSTIDPRIQHVRVIAEFFGDVNGRRVLDAGCGKGRFAKVLLDENPSAEIWGLDISEKMLSFMPPGIHTRQGVLTEIPFPDAFFDRVYATESLEHAVDIPKAVTELCRVLRTDGRLVIIDKNREHWGRLETPDWERWFDRREIETSLKRYCGSVSSKPISYWEDVEPDGLFLAWLAQK